MFRFSVIYRRGDSELMVVPDALSRDTMDSDVVLCHRCLKAVQEVSQITGTTESDYFLSKEEVLIAQEEYFGAEGVKIAGGDYVKDKEEVWCKILGRNDVRVAIPAKLIE